MSTRLMRRGAAAALTIFTSILVSLVAPCATTVSAHAGLEASEPAASAVLSAAPERILLDFDEPVEAAGASIELFDQDGEAKPVGTPALAVEDDSLVVAAVTATAAETLERGTYAVVWRIVSRDGHVIDGAFSFQIGTGTAADAGDLLNRVGSGGTSDDALSRVYGTARALGYLGVALVLGGGLLLLLARPQPERSSRLLVRAGAVLAVVSTAVAFASYSATIGSGRLGDLLDTGAWGTAIDTRTGHMLVVRLVALAILVLLSIGWAASRTGWWLATAAAASIVAAATFPGAGHGGAVSPIVLWVGLGALHTAGGLVWIGGLLVLATCRLRAERTFSRISAVAIPIVVVTGTIQTLELVDDLADLTATAWGNVLLVKIAVVVVALSVAGVSHWLVVHANGASLRRTVLTEGVLGLGIISLAAGLVALPPTVSAESRVFHATLAEAGVIADVTVTPGRVGANEIHVVITPPGSSIRPVENLTARMELPSRGIPRTPVTIEPDGPNHYTGRITLPFAGEWTLELIVETTPGSTTLVRTTVPIP